MVNHALWKKAVRDMAKSRAQFISIILMSTLAVGIVTGLDCIWFTIQRHADAIYSATNLSDLWVTVTSPSEKQLANVLRIPGVQQVEKRYSGEADTDLPGKPSLHFYALQDGSALDQPSLQSGSFAKYGGGAVLDENFAKSNNVSIGDVLPVKINDRWVSVPVTGLGLSSEQIFAISQKISMPNPKDYGFIVFHSGYLESAFGQKAYNQISVRISPGADAEAIGREAGEVIGDDLIGMTDRADSTSVSDVNSKIQQFKTLGIVFPALFFLVTALITQSTMSRLVDSQRGQIGILKALGYSRRSILWHYSSYGILVGLAGSLLGLAVGPNVFGRILVPRLRLSFADYRLYINSRDYLFASLLILLCTGGVAFYSCLRLQGDSPAVLLRDKPVREGMHVFLEGIPALWRKMKFSSKLIARNTLRNKFRMAMSIVGIMGCAGAILGALTILNMISSIPDLVYGQTFTYDQKVLLDTRKTDFRYLNNLMLNGVTQQTQEGAVELICPDGRMAMEPLTVTPKASPLIRLHDLSGNPVPLSDSGITISRRLCETLGVKQGDVLRIKRSDGKYASVRIVNVMYLAVGQGMYLTDTFWKSLGETFRPTALLVRWNGPPDQRFLQSDAVSSVISRNGQYSDTGSNIQVVKIAVVMMILMGAALAFVVLYNCSILNYAERIRDLATLRVLGFYQKEIRNLVLLENYFSAILGAAAGIPIGWVIADVVAKGLDSKMDIAAVLTVQNILLAGVMTLLFAWVINKIVSNKMKTLDMLSALKSVE